MQSSPLNQYAPIVKRFALLASHARHPESLVLLLNGHRTVLERPPLAINSIRAYERALVDLLAFFPSDRPLHSLTPMEAEEFISFLRSPKPITRENKPSLPRRGRSRALTPLAESTITVRVTAVRSLFSVFVWAGIIIRNPFDQITLARAQTDSHPPLVYYRQVELMEMLAAATIHDKCLILLGAQAGLRSKELYSLRWSEVSLSRQLIRIHSPKSAGINLSNQLVLSLQQLKALQESHRQNTEYVLDLRTQYGIYQRLRNICQAAGVDFKGVQALRNTCGRTLLIQSGDARIVQQHLRLRTLEQVSKYSTQAVEVSAVIADLQT